MFCKIGVGVKLLYVREDMRRIALIIIIILCLFGCSDTVLTRIPDTPIPEITVVMATHDSSIVNRRKKRVIELSAGKIVRDELEGSYI